MRKHSTGSHKGETGEETDSTQVQGHLDLDALRSDIEAGRIDTVLIAMTDIQGRLQGKQLTAAHFLDDVVEHHAEARGRRRKEDGLK